jgi:hypothetical protein
MVTVCTTRINIQNIYMMLTLHLYVLYQSQNKEQLSPYTVLRDWVCITEVVSDYHGYILSPCTKQVTSYLKDKQVHVNKSRLRPMSEILVTVLLYFY